MSVITRFSILFALLLGQSLVNTTVLNAKIPFSHSLETAFSCNLPAPSNVVVTNVTTNSISVDWDDVPGAIGYYVKATNLQTGQIYYTNTIPTSSDVATGLPSGTFIKVEVCAICNGGAQSGNYSSVIAQTEFIVVDDIAAQYPSTNPPIVPCRNTFILPACFQLDNSQVFEKTYFKIDYADPATGMIGVYHVNNDPIEKYGQILYPQGWYFADGGGTPPFYNNFRKTNNVLVYYQPSATSLSLGIPVFSFTIEHFPLQNSVNICHASSNYFSIRPSTCSNSSSKPTPTQEPSATEALQAYPNPFKNVLEVALGEAGAQETRLDLIDVNGRLVRTETAGAGTQSVSIETRDLAPGVYVLRCQSAATTKTLKVIKQ